MCAFPSISTQGACDGKFYTTCIATDPFVFDAHTPNFIRDTRLVTAPENLELPACWVEDCGRMNAGDHDRSGRW
jgi:hypothetical protein